MMQLKIFTRRGDDIQAVKIGEPVEFGKKPPLSVGMKGVEYLWGMELVTVAY
jgi:hypothetical protein